MESQNNKTNYQNSQCGLKPDGWAGKNRFRLKKLIGIGGMSEVWFAYDTRLKEFVALKFLLPHLAGNIEGFTRLRIETHRSRKLSHPNIVRIYDLYEEEDEIPFIAMEYVNGANLHQLRLIHPNSVLKWNFLSPLVRQLISAIKYAHSENVIHRDIKPSNILLDNEKRLKLADFGIARIVQHKQSNHPSVGFGGGTLDFISPQQAQGMSATYADDIYSIGATLYELLTGTPPFYKGDIEYQIKNTRPQLLSERLLEFGIDNPIPPSVESFIQKCLVKEPENRPFVYKEIFQYLDRADEEFSKIEEKNPSLVSTPDITYNFIIPEPTEQTQENVPIEEEKRITTSDLVKFGIFFLLIGFASGIIFMALKNKTSHPKSISEVTTRNQQLNGSPMIKSNEISKIETVESKPVATNKSLIAPIDQKPQTKQYSTETINDSNGKLLRQFAKGLNSAVCTPDELWTFVADTNGLLRMIDLRNGNVVWEEKIVNGTVGALAISINGRQFLTGDSTGTVTLWNVSGKEKLIGSSGHKAEIITAAFSPLRYAATADSNGTIKLWDIFSGRSLTEIKTKNGAIVSLLFLPHTPTLITGSETGVIGVYSIPSGKIEKMTQAHRGRIIGICHNSENNCLITSDTENIIKVWEVNSLKELKQFKHRTPLREKFTLMELCPDKKTIAIVTSSNYAYLFDASTLELIKKANLNIHSNRITDGCWLTKSSQFLTIGIDGSICIWDFNR